MIQWHDGHWGILYSLYYADVRLYIPKWRAYRSKVRTIGRQDLYGKAVVLDNCSSMTEDSKNITSVCGEKLKSTPHMIKRHTGRIQIRKCWWHCPLKSLIKSWVLLKAFIWVELVWFSPPLLSPWGDYLLIQGFPLFISVFTANTDITLYIQ